MLVDKLNEFKAAVDAIKVALVAQGVAVSAYTLASAAQLVGQVQTSRSMGSKSVTFTQRFVTLGVKITEAEQDPEKRVSYLDDAKGMVPVKTNTADTNSTNYYQWRGSWIFEKIYPVMLKSDGTIDYLLDISNQIFKRSGGSSDIADTSYNGNAMVCIEKFYTKFSMNGENEEIRISNVKQDGYEAIGFIREDGSEADCIYMPMFLGSSDSKNKLRSLSNQSVENKSFADLRKAAQRNGSNYDIETYAINQAISAVYFVLMKNCDPKTALGEGRTYSSAQTGILANKGAIACDPSTKTTKFMYIEDFTSSYINGIWRCEVGLLSHNNKISVKMKPTYYSTAFYGYSQVADHVYTNGSYITGMKCSNSYGRIPVAYNKGSSSTYESALWTSEASSEASVSRRSFSCGISGRTVSNPETWTDERNGAGLTYLPPA